MSTSDGKRESAPIDRDRLFTVPIVEYGMLRALRGAGVAFRAMASTERQARIGSLDLNDKDDANLHRCLREAASEIDAFEFIERVRKAVRQ